MGLVDEAASNRGAVASVEAGAALVAANLWRLQGRPQRRQEAHHRHVHRCRCNV